MSTNSLNKSEEHIPGDDVDWIIELSNLEKTIKEFVAVLFKYINKFGEDCRVREEISKMGFENIKDLRPRKLIGLSNRIPSALDFSQRGGFGIVPDTRLNGVMKALRKIPAIILNLQSQREEIRITIKALENTPLQKPSRDDASWGEWKYRLSLLVSIRHSVLRLINDTKYTQFREILYLLEDVDLYKRTGELQELVSLDCFILNN